MLAYQKTKTVEFKCVLSLYYFWSILSFSYDVKFRSIKLSFLLFYILVTARGVSWVCTTSNIQWCYIKSLFLHVSKITYLPQLQEKINTFLRILFCSSWKSKANRLQLKGIVPVMLYRCTNYFQCYLGCSLTYMQ